MQYARNNCNNVNIWNFLNLIGRNLLCKQIEIFCQVVQDGLLANPCWQGGAVLENSEEGGAAQGHTPSIPNSWSCFRKRWRRRGGGGAQNSGLLVTQSTIHCNKSVLENSEWGGGAQNIGFNQEKQENQEGGVLENIEEGGAVQNNGLVVTQSTIHCNPL